MAPPKVTSVTYEVYSYFKMWKADVETLPTKKSWCDLQLSSLIEGGGEI